jgi:hypothetical protein
MQSQEEHERREKDYNEKWQAGYPRHLHRLRYQDVQDRQIVSYFLNFLPRHNTFFCPVIFA